MRADFSSMLVTISDGFLVDSALILSPARPSELSSRCGAVPFRAILAICLFLASWMVSRAQHSSNLDHQNRTKTQPSREKIETKTNRKNDTFLSLCWNRFFIDFLGFLVPTRGSRATLKSTFPALCWLLEAKMRQDGPQTSPRRLRTPILYPT